jgi:hypothetical protein
MLYRVAGDRIRGVVTFNSKHKKMYQKKFLFIAIGMITITLPLILDLAGIYIKTPWNIHFWIFPVGVFGLGWSLGRYFFSPKTFYELDKFVKIFEGKTLTVERFLWEENKKSVFLITREIFPESKLEFFVSFTNPNDIELANNLARPQTGAVGKEFFVKGWRIYPKR